MHLIHDSFGSPCGTTLSYCRKVVFAIVTLSIIIFMIYGNSFDCSWHFDDEPNITDNPNLHLEKITWKNVRRAIFSDRNNPSFPYRPVACLSFALNHYFGGLDVWGYHLVNLFIHLLSSTFLFLFVYRTLNLPSLKTKYAAHSYSIALLATVLWAVNPVQTQAITYIVQRMASLAGMFYIMGMYLYLRARTAEKSRIKILLFVLCLVSFIMALGSKENAATLPLAVFLYEILLIQQDPSLFLQKNLKVLVAAFMVILVLGFTYLYIKDGRVFSFLDGYETRPFTLAQRLLTEPRIIIFYISLLLYPVPNRLNIAHSIELSTSLFSPIWTALSIVFIAGIIGYTIYSARKRPLLSFCVLFFFLNHVMESTVFPLELIFEHRNYIPAMFFFVPIAVGFYYLFDYYTAKRHMQYILSGFIVLFLIGLGHSTFLRNFIWKNEKSLWVDAIEKSPNLFRPHHNLGRYYDDHGYSNEAILEYKTALEKPASNQKEEFFITFYNLGRMYSSLKDYEAALSFYNKALDLKPDYAPIYNNIASIMDRRGEYKLAYDYLEKAFKLNPDSGETNLNLGMHYLKESQPDMAIYHLHRVENDELLAEKASLYLGIAYKQKGRFGRAAIYFKKALRRAPLDITPHLHLAEVFYRAGNHEQAKREAKQAINLTHDKATFDRILHDLRKKDQSSILHPYPGVIIPLLRDACLGKSEYLKEWSERLGEESLRLKAE